MKILIFQAIIAVILIAVLGTVAVVTLDEAKALRQQNKELRDQNSVLRQARVCPVPTPCPQCPAYVCPNVPEKAK